MLEGVGYLLECPRPGRSERRQLRPRKPAAADGRAAKASSCSFPSRRPRPPGHRKDPGRCLCPTPAPAPLSLSVPSPDVDGAVEGAMGGCGGGVGVGVDGGDDGACDAGAGSGQQEGVRRWEGRRGLRHSASPKPDWRVLKASGGCNRCLLCPQHRGLPPLPRDLLQRPCHRRPMTTSEASCFEAPVDSRTWTAARAKLLRQPPRLQRRPRPPTLLR